MSENAVEKRRLVVGTLAIIGCDERGIKAAVGGEKLNLTYMAGPTLGLTDMSREDARLLWPIVKAFAETGDLPSSVESITAGSSA